MDLTNRYMRPETVLLGNIKRQEQQLYCSSYLLYAKAAYSEAVGLEREIQCSGLGAI